MKWLCGQVSVAALTLGCAQAQNPVAPANSPGSGGPSPTAGNYSIAGAVAEATPLGLRALGGVSVNAWIQEDRSGYSYMAARGAVHTDADGRFELTALPASATVQLQVWKDGYVQQCALPEITAPTDARLEAQLVSRTNLSASPDSVPAAVTGFRSVSGVILERTDGGTRPAAGVMVDFESSMDFPAAVTYSDSAGRYLLCGLPDNRTITIGAGSGGRVAYVSIPPGQRTGADITLQ